MNASAHVVIALIALGLSLCGFLPARADIYRHVDANGTVTFTNAPQYTSVPSKRAWNFYRKEIRSDGQKVAPDGPMVYSYRELIRQHARSYGLEEALVKAVIKAESNYNPSSTSSKGALGLMQLIPETAQLMNVSDPFDPSQNIRGGSGYLRRMLDLFDGNLDLALAAYNAGPNAVQRHGGIPPYEETRNYVQRVRRYLEQYRRSGDAIL